MKYIDVIIETKSDSVDDFFTYISDDDSLEVGSCVEVPFIGSKPKTAYVFAIHENIPKDLEGKKLKKIISSDQSRSIPADCIKIVTWMKRRYFCRYIDGVGCFTPAKIPASKKKAGNPEAETPETEIPETETQETAEKNKGTGKKDIETTASADTQTPEDEFDMGELPTLTPEQKNAWSQISRSMKSGKPQTWLIHGVTGSGKTEIYLRCTKDCLDEGKSVIVILPEISLTPQSIERFTERFGASKIAVLHSRLTKKERNNEWKRIREGLAQIVIGARSAVFAPFDNVGLIVVDEEHETTYKSDQAPKYDAVEVAVKRATRAGATCLLGSATPSVVSMYRAENGIYKLLKLKKRFNDTPLPELISLDMRDELKSGNRSIFSGKLHSRITDELGRGKQAILFLNRRGYSPFISCRSCGYVLRCPECGISMTWHKSRNKAICHFCGKSLAVPKECPGCGSGSLRYFGIGTEQVEEAATKTWPEAKIARLDLDIAIKKGSMEKVLKAFAQKKTDILIGTQMVAKGLDFENVSTVGVIAADLSLNIPDFRSGERTWALITQVAGRAGRRDEQGQVIVQTYMPDNYAIEAAVKGRSGDLYETELMIRKNLRYPPYSDIIQLMVYSSDEAIAERATIQIRRALLRKMGQQENVNILGPQKSVLAKIGQDFRYGIHIKAMPEKRREWESALTELKKSVNTDKKRGYRIVLDVNPYSFI